MGRGGGIRIQVGEREEATFDRGRGPSRPGGDSRIDKGV